MQIETKRLIFRKWKLSDVDDLVDCLNDFELVKNMTMPFPYTKNDAIEFLAKRQQDDKNTYYFAVTTKSGELVGGTSLSLNKDGEFRGGIYVHRKFRGQGYGQEIFIARAKFAFDYLKLNEIRNGFFEFNEKSKNMQQKMGYKIVGKTKNYSPSLNSEVVEIITKLKKEDFDKYYKTLDFEFKLTT
jgi:RimJ/RimL family protein N-acetyltransferase